MPGCVNGGCVPCWTGIGADCKGGWGGAAKGFVGTVGAGIGNVVSKEYCGGVGGGGYCCCG